MFDKIIENGFVVDGTGCSGRYADVAISAGKIAAVGQLKGLEARERVDANGYIVAPGHITPHTHYDVMLFWDPYCDTAGENGVTTIVNANCGFSIAPVRPADRERTMAMLETTEQIPVAVQRAALPWDWETFPEFLARVGRLPKGLNVYSYIPLNPLLVYVMGIDAAKARQPNDDEIAEMHRIIHEGMDAGAIGISMSVMGAAGNSHLDFDGTCMPSDLLSIESVLRISQAIVDRGEGVIQMLSQISYYGDRSFTEKVAELCKGTGVRILHNTFLTNPARPEEALNDKRWIEELRARGLDVISPCRVNRGWVESNIRGMDTAAGQLEGIRRICACDTDEEIMRLLGDTAFVKDFSDDYDRRGAATGADGMEGQIVIDVGDNQDLKPFLGKTMAEIGALSGKNAVETLCDLAFRSNLQLQVRSPLISMDEPDQAVEVLREPSIYPSGSDGGAHTKSFDMAGYHTDLLIWIVREKRLMSLEEMHHNLSLKQARAVSIYDRGALLPGFWGDVIIYKLEELFEDLDRYYAVNDVPGGEWRRKAKVGGYHKVLVNGVVTYEDGAFTGKHPGHMGNIVPSPSVAAVA